MNGTRVGFVSQNLVIRVRKCCRCIVKCHDAYIYFSAFGIWDYKHGINWASLCIHNSHIQVYAPFLRFPFGHIGSFVPLLHFYFDSAFELIPVYKVPPHPPSTLKTKHLTNVDVLCCCLLFGRLTFSFSANIKKAGKMKQPLSVSTFIYLSIFQIENFSWFICISYIRMYENAIETNYNIKFRYMFDIWTTR